MQVSVENGPGLERRMTVGLESEQIDTEVEKRLREFARSAKVPGFRPGKVPLKVLRQRYGGQVRQEAFGELVLSSFSEAVAQEELQPAATPRIEPDIDESAGRYAYTAIFEVLPEFELGPLDDKTIKRPLVEITDADMETVITRMREQQKTWSAVERPARMGDRLTASFTAASEGKPLEDFSKEDVWIELGVEDIIPGFDEGLLGVQAGDERQLDLSFPDEYPPNLEGKPVIFEVRVSEVAEPVLPEIDADFAETFGFSDGDLDGFRSEVRRNMERQLKDGIADKIKNRVIDLLLETTSLDLPEVLVRQEIENLKQRFRQAMENIGENRGGSNLELPDDLFLERARRRVGFGLILAEIVKVNAIEVDPKQVREMVEDLASTRENPQQIIDYYYARKELLETVESLALEKQVIDWVLDQVAVEDEPITWEEFNAPPAFDEETSDEETPDRETPEEGISDGGAADEEASDKKTSD